jgi:hypothetical protein
MKPIRIASVLAAVSVAVATLLAVTAQPAAASNCNITGPDGAHGQYICGTQTHTINWWTIGSPDFPPIFLGQETVVVGTDDRVYHDSGSGWKILNGGAVLPTAPAAKMGVLPVSGVPAGLPGSPGWYQYEIRVLGTTGHYYCSGSIGPDAWSAWHTSNCPQN